MPFVAFVLLAAVCLLMIGFACACLTDQPAQVTDRAVSLGSQLAMVIEVWSPAAVGELLALLTVLVLTFARPNGRASPAVLQRFLF